MGSRQALTSLGALDLGAASLDDRKMITGMWPDCGAQRKAWSKWT